MEEFVFIVTSDFSNPQKLLSVLFNFHHISTGRVGKFHVRCKFCLSCLSSPPSLALYTLTKSSFSFFEVELIFPLFCKAFLPLSEAKECALLSFDVSHYLERNKPLVVTSVLVKGIWSNFLAKNNLKIGTNICIAQLNEESRITGNISIYMSDFS